MKNVRPAATVAIFGIVGAVAGCGSLADGELQLYSALYADPEELASQCENWLGPDKEVSEVIGVDVSFDDALSADQSACVYQGSADLTVAMHFDGEDSGSDSVAMATGVSTVLLTASDPAALASENAEDVQAWVDGRAEDVVDDYEEWYSSLSEATAGEVWIVATEDVALPGSDYRAPASDESLTQTGVMNVPGAVVSAYEMTSLPFVRVDGEVFKSPADGVLQLINVDVSGADAPGSAALDAAGDGASPTEVTWSDLEAMSVGGSAENARALVAAVGPDDSPVLRVDTDGAVQELDIATGAVNDDGQSQTLEGGGSGTFTSPEHTDPVWYHNKDTVFRRAGDPSVRASQIRPAFEQDIAVQWMSWDAELGWADVGSMWLTVELQPSEWTARYRTDDYELTFEDLSAESFTVDAQGETITATTLDTSDSSQMSVVFEIPADSTSVSLVATYEPSRSSLDAMYLDKEDQTFEEGYSDMTAAELRWELALASGE